MDDTPSSQRAPLGIIAVAVAATYAAAVVLLFGAMTNWFRYGLSLEASYVAAPAVLGLLVAAGTATVAWRTSRVAFAIATFVVAGGFSLLTLAAHHEAFGSGGPKIALSHVETSGIATLHAHSRTVHYELQLHDPFASSHREYLVLQVGHRSYRIRVQILDSASGGYAVPNAPNDWIVLRPTPDPAIYIAETGSFLPSRGVSNRSTDRTRGSNCAGRLTLV